MLKRSTVFVLGAGAGAELGLPVGSTLAKHISSMMDVRFDPYRTVVSSGDYELFDVFKKHYGEQSRNYNQAAWSIRDGIHLASSIDDFLESHRANEHILLYGKCAIAKSILKAEENSSLYYEKRRLDSTIDFSRLDNTWINKLTKILFRGITREKAQSVFHNAIFINFNYDRCLEHYFIHALCAFYRIEKHDAETVVASAAIIHPYGSIGPLENQQGRRGIPFGADCGSHVLNVASSIRTYSEQVEDQDVIGAIGSAFESSEQIVFLGFAYHDQNLALLRTDKGWKATRILGSAIGISEENAEFISGILENCLSKSGRTKSSPPKLFLRHLTCSDFIDRFDRIIGS